MIGQNAVFTKAGTVGSSTADLAVNRLGFISLLLLSAWCGLVAGLLEVGTIVLRKQMFDPDPFFKMSRQFVWLIPLTNFGVFLTLGLFGCGVILIRPRHGRWLFTRGFCAMALLPAMLVAGSRIYTLAWMVVALGRRRGSCHCLSAEARFSGDSSCSVFRRPSRSWRSRGHRSGWATESSKSRESARALPPPGSPNVLLIVMDTVAARHLSLHGYDLRHQHDPGRARRARHPIRFRSGSLIMDPAVSCDHVYRTMVARTLGRLAHAP